MRITANIIDEEPYAFDLVSSKATAEHLSERKSNGTDINWFSKNSDLGKDSSKKKPEKIQCGSGYLHDVTQRFRNLHLSDTSYPNMEQNCVPEDKHPERPQEPLTPYSQYFLEQRGKYSKDNPEMSMTDIPNLVPLKFLVNLSEEEEQKYEEAYKRENEIYRQELKEFFTKSKAVRSEAANLSAFCMFETDQLKKEFSQASTSKSMEKVAGDSATPTDVPPSWLHQCLIKIKNEIKKEVMEELLQVSQGEMHCNKSGASVKPDENQFDFQGEVIHAGIFCDNCDQLIHGIRYKCGNCSDFDLCQECESLPNIHNKNHIFLKIRYPVALKMYQRQKWQELISPATGKIYMSSRNRQAKKLYEAKFVRDETVPDSTVLSPSTKFVKSWRVVNSGTRVWTHATKLHLIQGSPDLIPSNDHVDVPHLKPGEEGIVSVLFTSPPYPGLYRSHWNFCHKSRPFGDIVWCHIVVKSPTEEALGEVVPSEKASSSTAKILDKVAENKQSEVSCIAEVLTAVKKEHERGNMVPRKLVVTSHTATPNNTPFDLTPPKSPDHHEASVGDLQDLTSNNSHQTRDSDYEDDECSVVSLGSSESDTEFVVIPMPKCFNLSESFVSQHVPHWFQDCPKNAADGSPVKTVHKTIQLEEQEVAVLSSENSPSQNATRRPTLTSETVSQETGVPELSENACDRTLLELVDKLNSKINCVSVVTDGSSSEISIIGSEDNSPTVECAAQTIGSINISMSSETAADGCEVDTVEVHLDNTTGSRTAVQEVQTENEDQATDIPCSATFPKFPIEGITATYDPSPASNEERIVQVLPEGLVTGALSAAASVYNTARAVISGIQQPRTERGVCLSQEPPTVRIDSTPDARSTTLNAMDQLIEMGFSNRQQNEELLKKHNGDVPSVVAELVSLNDNDWYASRHIPSPPPCFD